MLTPLRLPIHREPIRGRTVTVPQLSRCTHNCGRKDDVREQHKGSQSFPAWKDIVFAHDLTRH